MTSELWDKLLKRFADNHDFPFHFARPTINNEPRTNLPRGWRLRPEPMLVPCRGMFRAYLRRRARGIL